MSPYEDRDPQLRETDEHAGVWQRGAAGEPAGLLVLHHGRGTHEQDLLPLADVLDPQPAPCGGHAARPLRLPGWPGYRGRRAAGYPDRETAKRAAASPISTTLAAHGLTPERTTAGGFSMGAVMRLRARAGRTTGLPAGILAFRASSRWSRAGRLRGPAADPAGFHHHGRRPDHGSRFRARAERYWRWGLDVEYHESDGAHHIDPPTSPARPVGSPRLCRSRRQRRAERQMKRS